MLTKLAKFTAKEEYKQCIVMRGDLKLSKGKLAAQAAHAAVSSYERAPRRARRAWLRSGQKKVVLRVSTLGELLELKRLAETLGLPCALVQDAGLTEVPKGTVTALGIGPAKAEKIDKVTGNLSLL
ncbi:peptidyl-tRNA hydrolase Pth2 [Candidatus Alkanophaga liquidiphilum]|nr:Peptidyl-tRNA hydrolase [Candidatus Alkanophaga liquidiphilum]RLG38232.1 MAG: peptidyl-tRNA hydrolase [Candidatus Alkanophagales archaeon]